MKSTLKKINSDFLSASLSEDEVIKTISDVYKKNKLILDPHTCNRFCCFR
jgi:threonine synthase